MLSPEPASGSGWRTATPDPPLVCLSQYSGHYSLSRPSFLPARARCAQHPGIARSTRRRFVRCFVSRIRARQLKTLENRPRPAKLGGLALVAAAVAVEVRRYIEVGLKRRLNRAHLFGRLQMLFAFRLLISGWFGIRHRMLETPARAFVVCTFVMPRVIDVVSIGKF